jgi:hypothetical protein
MKLRIRGDSLRLRVGPSEAQQLAAGGKVLETISFGLAPHQTLTYCLEAADSVVSTIAVFESNCIRVTIPLKAARQWFESDTIAIEANQAIDRTRSLQLLIEKDFECLDRKTPTGEDTYPHPTAAGSCSTATD